MKFILAIAVMFSAMLAVAAELPFKGDAAKAQGIVNQVCAACHAADGNSQIASNPNLAGQIPEYLYKQLEDFKAAAGKKAEAGHQLSLPASTAEDRSSSAMTASVLLTRVANSLRLSAMDQLIMALEVDVPETSNRRLFADDLGTDRSCDLTRCLVRRAHLYSSDSHALRDERIMCDEIVVGKNRIEEMLRKPVSAFAYPNGKPEDLDDSVVDTVRRAGLIWLS